MKKSNIKRQIKNLCFSILLCVTAIPAAYSQYIEKYPISEANGDKMFELNNYQEAIRQYTSLLMKDPSNLDYKFKLGMSYTYSSIDKKKGLEILKKLSEFTDAPEETEVELGIAYFMTYEFDAALLIFEKLNNEAETEEDKQDFQTWIGQVNWATNMYNNPVSVSFEHLDKSVNSNAPDYLPIINPDESNLIFTSRRAGVVGNLYDFGGYRTADIYLSKHKKNNYSRARSIGSPNSYGNEQTSGRSENGNYIIYNVNSENYFNDLFVSEKGKRSYMPAKEFESKEVNQKSNEMGASLNNEGTVMYFCSDREGGMGGFDIYVVQRLPNGEWGLPKNIGAPINTPGDEKYPNLMNEGTQMYYSSNGHRGIGGMDLFKSILNEEDQAWSEPINLGYPINTTDDDLNISFASNKRYAYIATKRDDSFGDLDIYRITFEEESDNYTLLSGRLLDTDSAKISEEAMIEVFRVEDESLYGTYLVNPKSGKYSAILPAGKYRIELVEVSGFQDFLKEINLLGKNDFEDNKTLDIVLQKSQ